jgi:hypothetical protein
MADNRGGYQQPTNPAPVSGPGALSQRTDGGATEGMTQPVQEYSGLPYGQNKSLNDSQGASSMAGDPFKSPLLDLMAPSTRPDEPITAGINSGPGGGTELMRGMPNSEPNIMDTLKTIMQFDTSGDAELLYRTLTDNGYGS